MTAVMAASIPASIIFGRYGRRTGFMLGALISILGSVTFSAGVWMQDFVIYCTGSAFAGMGFGIAQHYRFAAAEAATPAYRPRAIALVMAGARALRATWPEIVKHTLPGLHALHVPWHLHGFGPAAGDLHVPADRPGASAPPCPGMRRSRPRWARSCAARPLPPRPAGLVAYGTMNLAMTATPLEMLPAAFRVSASATVIQAHAIAMYAPGFFTGRLITPAASAASSPRRGADRAERRHRTDGRDLLAFHRRSGGVGRRLELHVRRRHLAAGHGLRAA